MSSNHGADESRTREAAASREERRGRLGISFIGEVLLVALLVVFGSLLIVTFPAALAAGIGHLRRHISGRDTSLGRFGREFASSFRSLWPAGLALPTVAFFVDLNIRMARSGMLPGATVVIVATMIVALLVTVLALRSAAAWTRTTGVERDFRPGIIETTRLARDHIAEDFSGSVIVAVAVAGCVGLVWAFWPLLVLVGVIMAVVLVGVESRRVRRSR